MRDVLGENLSPAVPWVIQILSSGAEGLLKLWDVRSGECTASFEDHEGKVWALTSGGPSDSVVASGGADSTINIWEDASQHQLEETSNAKLAEIAATQEFQNALQVARSHHYSCVCGADSPIHADHSTTQADTGS